MLRGGGEIFQQGRPFFWIELVVGGPMPRLLYPVLCTLFCAFTFCFSSATIWTT